MRFGNRVRLSVLAILVAKAAVCTTSIAQDNKNNYQITVDAVTTVHIGKERVLQSLLHAWTFDKKFAEFATEGLEAKTKGVWTREELQPLAEVNIKSLDKYKYFTEAYDENHRKIEFNKPENYYLEFANQRLTLHFTLRPIQKNLFVSKIIIVDPTKFVSFKEDNDGWILSSDSGRSPCGALIEQGEHELSAQIDCSTKKVTHKLAQSVRPNPQKAKTYLIHRNWFFLTGRPDSGSLIFRKFLPVESGLKNITNFHCPRSRNDDMFVTLDLTSTRETSGAIQDLTNGKYQIMFKQDGKNLIHIPFLINQATYKIERKGRVQGFELIMSGGQDFNFALFGDGEMLMETSFDEDLTEEVTKYVNRSDVQKSFGFRTAELHSTVNMIALCTRYRLRTR